MKCDPHKTLRLNVSAADIGLNGAVGEVGAFDPDQPHTGCVVHAHTIADRQRRGFAVDGPEAPGH